MFINLSYLFNSIFLFSDYQSGRSCLRRSCIAPYSSVHVRNAGFLLSVTTDIAIVQDGVIEIKVIVPQRSNLAVRRYAVVESALLRYKEMHGDMLVPNAFIVPSDDESWPEETWGMKLGTTVSSIRCGASYKDREEELISIGFDYKSLRATYGYAVIESALLRYRKEYGDMLVPKSFVIPRDDESWPEETWGLTLGRTVSHIRCGNSYKDKREELISIGLDYSLRRSSYKYAEVKSALLRYKEEYGDMLVRRSFIIPSDDESWPEETWGMKLGSTVSKIRLAKSFKDKQKELTSIGIDYSSQSNRKVKGSTIVESTLPQYDEEAGDTLIPQPFIISDDYDPWPEETWGKRLGVTASAIRGAVRKEDKQEELASIDFDSSPRRIMPGYAAVKLALLRYMAVHGDMLVSTPFIIPTDDESWPEETWGMRLGKTVGSIRSGNSYKGKKQELISIGFDYSPQIARYGYEATESALLQYKEMYGDMLVPQSFIVPSDDESWPEEAWGMKLGVTANCIRCGVSYKDMRKELASIGFDYNPRRIMPGYVVVESVLLRYKELHGDMLVPARFIIPSDDDVWTEETWGMKLGQTVSSIRCGASYKDREEELRKIGFDYSSLKLTYDYPMVESALLRYKKEYGDMLVPQSFVVPGDDESWPVETWGMKLGTKASRIRFGNSCKDKREELISIGFDYNSQSTAHSYAIVKSALLRYKEMYGDMEVIRLFDIPVGNELWPEKTWGMKLGKVVASIRSGDIHKGQRKDLVSIGLDYSPRVARYSYALVESALLRYKEVHGDMLVPRSFIVPTGDELWPEETWGMKLGTTVRYIRRGTSYKDQQEDLINIGFVFKIEKISV